MEEIAAGRSIRRQHGQGDRCFCPFFHLDMTVLIGISANIARVGGIDLDRACVQCLGQVDGKGVERGFAGIVGKCLELLKAAFRITMQGK